VQIKPGTERILRWCEFVAASLITVLIVFLHVKVWRSAGALWRDEVCSLHVATMPSLKESWHLLAFENQPLFHYLILRGWSALPFAGTDFGLRALSLVIGILLAGAIWLACWLINKTPPLWALAFFGMNPHTFRTDILRPHGLGLVWIVLTFAFFWQLTFQKSPRLGTIVLATIAAVMSVQTFFLNAVLLGALCISSAVVLAFKYDWRKIALVFGIGLAAALSLLPYLPQIEQARQWNVIRAETHTFVYLIAVFLQIVTYNDLFLASLFGSLVLLGIASAVVPRMRKRLAEEATDSGKNCLFAVVTFVAAVIGTSGFLWLLTFPLQDRYYLPLLAVTALSITSIASTFRRSTAARVLILLASIALAAGYFPHAANKTKLRLTNCDLAATAVTESEKPDDLIVLSRFGFGITFERYYHGNLPWHCIPDISDRSLFRWDLVKDAMAQPDPMHDLLIRAELALRSGNRVFVVGHFNPSRQPPPMPPAPSASYGWNMEAYLANWRQQLVGFLVRHGSNVRSLPLPDQNDVDPVERMGVTVISGWR